MTRIFKTDNKLQDLLDNTVPNGECLEWTRCFNTDGYARMGGNVKVHRLVYELATGLNPKGLVVRHTCDNIKCINPDHLIIGTLVDNNRDRDERGRTYKVITLAIIRRTLHLLASDLLSQKEIALLVGIDARRVSDIHNGKYCSATGKFLGHG